MFLFLNDALTAAGRGRNQAPFLLLFSVSVL